MRQKTNVPEGHWHTCHGATPTPPRPKKLIGSERFPQVALVGAGGSGPLDPRPAPPLTITKF